jgi:hypothetical protein
MNAERPMTKCRHNFQIRVLLRCIVNGIPLNYYDTIDRPPRLCGAWHRFHAEDGETYHAL